MAANRASVTRSTGPLIADDQVRAAAEARNALRQFDAVCTLARERFGNLRLTPADVCALQKIAVDGIFACAGTFRQVPITISNTPHCPPEHDQVPALVAEMCTYANSKCMGDPIHTSAYLMWRHNWIHPFADGNGRTSRAVSYLALCAGFAMELPGKITVPELITTHNKIRYYDALDAADAAWKNGQIDVSAMQSLISELLKQQLASA